MPSNHEHLQFAFTVVCDAVSPQRWHGEVSFAGTTLITTPAVATDDQAERDAVNALIAKVIDLFSS